MQMNALARPPGWQPRDWYRLVQIVGVSATGRVTGEKSLEDRVGTAEFDTDHLESLVVTAFQLLGKPEDEAQELAKAILRAAERPQSGDPGPPDPDPT
jgi:hypothetical protein